MLAGTDYRDVFVLDKRMMAEIEYLKLDSLFLAMVFSQLVATVAELLMRLMDSSAKQ